MVRNSTVAQDMAIIGKCALELARRMLGLSYVRAVRDC